MDCAHFLQANLLPNDIQQHGLCRHGHVSTFLFVISAYLSLGVTDVIKGASKNAVNGIFLHGKAKNAVFASLHFQSLVAIENGGKSLCRAATSIFRGALKSVARMQARIHDTIRKGYPTHVGYICTRAC
jgi:hypothetical protein